MNPLDYISCLAGQVVHYYPTRQKQEVKTDQAWIELPNFPIHYVFWISSSFKMYMMTWSMCMYSWFKINKLKFLNTFISSQNYSLSCWRHLKSDFFLKSPQTIFLVIDTIICLLSPEHIHLRLYLYIVSSYQHLSIFFLYLPHTYSSLYFPMAYLNYTHK